MNNHINIKTHLVSLFVYHSVFKDMAWGISFASLMSIDAPLDRVQSGEIQPSRAVLVALPLLCLLAGMASMSLEEPIVDRATFEVAMKGIFEQFEEFEEFEEFDEFPFASEQAMTLSKKYMNRAKRRGLAALEEALAGFPVCGGDLAVWDDYMLESSK